MVEGVGLRHCLVLPMPTQTLEEFLLEGEAGGGRRAGTRAREDETVLSVLLGVARSVEYLHDKNLVLCDLDSTKFGRVSGR